MQSSINSEHSQFASSIHLKEDEIDLFMIAWDTLMRKFSITDSHQLHIFAILRNFFSTVDTDFLTIYELNNSLEAIKFFIIYKEAMDKIEMRHKSSSANIDSLVKLQFLVASTPLTLNYPNIGKAYFNLLYKLLRTSDLNLLYHLEPYPELPSLKTLYKIKAILDNEYDYKYQLWLIDTIEQLKEYINGNLSKPLSRTTNLFTFELLYLFNILQYGGKVNKSDCAKFKLKNESVKSKFLPLVSLTDSQKSNTVKAIIINAAKVNKYRNSKPGSKVEN